MTETALPKPLHTDRAPDAIGPYSQAQIVSVAGVEWVYTSGQVGLDPETGELVSRETLAQAKQVLANCRAVLAAARCNFADVVKTTIYLADMADFQAVNEVYAEAMGEARPARATVEVSRLPKDGRIEIDMVAVRSIV